MLTFLETLWHFCPGIFGPVVCSCLPCGKHYVLGFTHIGVCSPKLMGHDQTTIHLPTHVPCWFGNSFTKFAAGFTSLGWIHWPVMTCYDMRPWWYSLICAFLYPFHFSTWVWYWWHMEIAWASHGLSHGHDMGYHMGSHMGRVSIVFLRENNGNWAIQW